MKSEDYWYIFSESGKIADYIKYSVIKQAEQTEENSNASKHEGTYSQRTEYR